MSELLRDYSFYDWCAMIVVCSFIGFCIENSWLAVTKGYIDNRNMHLPFLFGYGLAVVACYAVMGLPDDSPDLMYFVGLFLFVSCGEIVLGKFVELVCGFYYWDYTRLPLHVTRYTSVFTSLGFATAIIVFMRHAFPLIMGVAEVFDFDSIHNLEVVALIALAVDCAISFAKMHRKHGLLELWKIDVWHRHEGEDAEEVRTKIA